MSVLIVIPARYASIRYPGKPLVPLAGATGEAKSLVQRAWEAACEVSDIDRVVIATDDVRIQAEAGRFGAEVVMTSEDCSNGTERCAETLDRLGGEYDIVVNLQGDAPLTPPWFINDLVQGLRKDETADAATPVLRCDGRALNRFLKDRAQGRTSGTTAVFAQNSHALYFSKEVLPYTVEVCEDAAETSVFHHVGVYAYRPVSLREYKRWGAGKLELQEGLEQLRFLENGRKILCVEVSARGRQFWELNNPEDVVRIEAMMVQMDMM